MSLDSDLSQGVASYVVKHGRVFSQTQGFDGTVRFLYHNAMNSDLIIKFSDYKDFGIIRPHEQSLLMIKCLKDREGFETKERGLTGKLSEFKMIVGKHERVWSINNPSTMNILLSAYQEMYEGFLLKLYNDLVYTFQEF